MTKLLNTELIYIQCLGILEICFFFFFYKRRQTWKIWIFISILMIQKLIYFNFSRRFYNANLKTQLNVFSRRFYNVNLLGVFTMRICEFE